LLLKCWNGERYISDRAVTGTVNLNKPYLSICLAGQPYILENLMANQAFMMSGLVARFIYCFPKTNIGMRKYETEPIPHKVSDMYGRMIKFLLSKKFEKPRESEICLSFDEYARANFADYFDRVIEPMQTTDFAECRDWGGKYHGLILRIGGILHCVTCFTKGLNPESEKVSVDTLCHAIDLADYYKEQAIFAYGLREIDNEVVKAEHILKKIRAKYIREIKQRDLYRMCRCKYFNSVQDFEKSLELLEEYGYIYRESIESPNRNRQEIITVYVNPKIYES
jgi:hypothetical protein